MSELPASDAQSDLGCRVLIVFGLPGLALVFLLIGNLLRPPAPEAPTPVPLPTEPVIIAATATPANTLNALEIALTEISAGQTLAAQESQQSSNNPVAVAQVASPTEAVIDVAITPTITPSFTAIIPTATPTHTASVPTATASFTAVIAPPTSTAIPPTNTSLPAATATTTALVPTATVPIQVVQADTASATPIPPTSTPVPTETIVASGGTYVVQSGDTLFQIALTHNTTVDAINAANNLGAADYIFPGQELILPAGASDLAPEPTSTSTIAPTADTIAPTNAAPTAELIPLTLAPMTEIAVILPTIPAQIPPLPAEVAVNGIEDDQFILIPDNVVRNIQQIYENGQAMGRNPHAFTRIGDSTIEMPHFFTRFDATDYHLGDYGYLQGVIDYYAGSFNHDSVAVRRGLHTWSVFDPQWARGCQPQEHMLACEFRKQNPSIILIRLGSNDRGVPDSTDQYMRQIVEYSIANGVIPVMGTKADRFDGPSDVNNTLIRRIAFEYELPLWDFDLVASTVPGRGLGSDNVHMTFFYAHDWRQAGGFQTGHGVHNLTGLIVLDAVWRALNEPV